MISWHKKKFVIGELNAAGNPASELLFKEGGTNEIWFVPLTRGDDRKCFTVGYETGQVGIGWRRWVLFEEGSVAFDPGVGLSDQTDDTERLEGVGVVGEALRLLRLYREVMADGKERLHTVLTDVDGESDQELAIGHP